MHTISIIKPGSGSNEAGMAVFSTRILPIKVAFLWIPTHVIEFKKVIQIVPSICACSHTDRSVPHQRIRGFFARKPKYETLRFLGEGGKITVVNFFRRGGRGGYNNIQHTFLF